MWIKEHGVKKTWNKKYETYAYVQDTGKYLTPVTWLSEIFNTKKEATEWLNNKLKQEKETCQIQAVLNQCQSQQGHTTN